MSQNPQTPARSTRGEECPPWCQADHEHQGDEPERWHHSAVSELPLVELARVSGRSDRGVVDVAVAFDVALEQPWGSPNAYVLLGVGAERARTFCLTLESAERLIAALTYTVRIGRAQA